MRRTNVVTAVVLGLGLLAAPAVLDAADPVAAGSSGIEVQAALDMFLEIRPVCGEGSGPCPGR